MLYCMQHSKSILKTNFLNFRQPGLFIVQKVHQEVSNKVTRRFNMLISRSDPEGPGHSKGCASGISVLSVPAAAGWDAHSVQCSGSISAGHLQP